MAFESSNVSIPFVKMHGTGNDFVIIDCRAGLSYPNMDAVRMADRRRGIGCDQVIVLHPSVTHTCKMLIFNSDGGQVETCGNGIRCVLWLITTPEKPAASIELINRSVFGERVTSDGQIRVNMGKPLYGWQEIPLSSPQDTLSLNLQMGCLKSPVATNVGNPHVTFFVDDLRSVPFEALAPLIENHALFPNRVNVTIAQVVRDDEIEVRIWERGAGITESCGSAACATLFAAVRKGLIRGSKARIKLPGGNLTIEYENGTIYMTGEAVFVFRGNYVHSSSGSEEGATR